MTSWPPPLPPALRAPLDEESEEWMHALPWAPIEPALEQLRALPPSRVRAVPAGKLTLHRGARPTGVSIPILGYLLDAPGARMVVDCGLSERWRPADAGPPAELPEDGPAPGMRYRPVLDGPSLADQARSLDFAPQRLVCTHLHLDHAGGARALGLPVEAGAREWDEAGSGAAGYPSEDLASLPAAPISLDPSRPFGPFAASAWLADGVLALETAGHTPGSISVLVRLGSTFALICGDAVYPVLDAPRSAAYLGMLRLRRLIASEPGIVPLPAHDTGVQRACAGGRWLFD